jgi:hypothetical protein
MAIFQQNLPASLRFGPQPAQENRGASSTDRRPYLIAVPTRKTVAPVRQTIAATRQFFSLLPHEPEDARLTGATRSLYRRLLALNLPKSVRIETSSEVVETRFTLIDARPA